MSATGKEAQRRHASAHAHAHARISCTHTYISACILGPKTGIDTAFGREVRQGDWIKIVRRHSAGNVLPVREVETLKEAYTSSKRGLY